MKKLGATICWMSYHLLDVMEKGFNPDYTIADGGQHHGWTKAQNNC